LEGISSARSVKSISGDLLHVRVGLSHAKKKSVSLILPASLGR
jgi:hypothetical protein